MKQLFDPNKIMNIMDVKRIKNLIPGTLVYQGKVVTEFGIALMVYHGDSYESKYFEKAAEYIAFVNDYDKQDDSVYWTNIFGLSSISEIKELGTFFDIPDMTLEQVLNITKHTTFKMERDHLFGDLQMISLKDINIEVENIGMYLKANHVITFQEKRGDVFDGIRERIQNNKGHVRTGAGDYLYYLLLDALVDNYLDVMEKVKVDINLLEEEIINEEQMNIRNIHDLRKILLFLRLTATSFEKLVDHIRSRRVYDFVSTKQSHLDNLYDHIRELGSEIALQREIVNTLFENYMLNNGNEMNKVMTTLTIFSAVFIPLSFLAGVFGMNFEFMPGLSDVNGFYVFGGFCIVVALAMVTLFKVKKWF